MEPPPPIITQPDYCILIDFEATCDTSDENLTRLQQCDTHEYNDTRNGAAFVLA